MKYKIADLIIEYEPKYEMSKLRSNKYKIENASKTDYKITITDKDIEKETLVSKDMTNESSEYMIFGSTFYKALLNHKGCLLHSSGVVIDNEAYLFSAPCGTGKSTHTSLWLKYLTEKKPYILNDDKPAVRIMEDGIYAYGTPFSGKHDINENKKVKLKAICFLEQSKINFIQKIEPKDAIKLFLEQTVRKLNQEEMLKLLEIIDIILKEIPIYKLYCDMTEEAVQLSYKTMKGDTNEN